MHRPHYTNTFLCYLPTYIYSYVYIQLELIPLQTTTNTPRRSMNGCVFILFIFLFTIIYTSSFNSSLFQKLRANSRSECIRCSTEHMYNVYSTDTNALQQIAACTYPLYIVYVRVVYFGMRAGRSWEKKNIDGCYASEKL